MYGTLQGRNLSYSEGQREASPEKVMGRTDNGAIRIQSTRDMKNK